MASGRPSALRVPAQLIRSGRLMRKLIAPVEIRRDGCAVHTARHVVQIEIDIGKKDEQRRLAGRLCCERSRIAETPVDDTAGCLQSSDVWKILLRRPATRQ